MAAFRFSRRAEADLLQIGSHTLEVWGELQTLCYLNALEECCEILAENPAVGRAADDVRRGLCRHEHGKHVIFYRAEAKGILMSRILHQRMLPERHAPEDET